MTDFPALLDRFAAAVVANDGAGLAAVFTEKGTYEDGFFGAHTGRAVIAQMLQRFHDTGRDYRWDWFEPLCDGALGYARFRFSYASRLQGCEGRPVMFEGMSRFRFEGKLIAHYAEAWDRGVALVQLGLPPERIARILDKAAAVQNGTPEAREHLVHLSPHPR
ncbi:MAG TPA: nuclear transport factor 2 family protein [Stellaceae bacterium]|nr:nuclear transport factor 2 family protein [Stellaceae bacterium]